MIFAIKFSTVYRAGFFGAVVSLDNRIFAFSSRDCHNVSQCIRGLKLAKMNWQMKTESIHLELDLDFIDTVFKS